MAQSPSQYQGLQVVEPGNSLIVYYNDGNLTFLQRLGTQLIAPHSDGKLTFLYPSYGPDTFTNVGLAIQKDNLKKPTMSETASLVRAAFISDDSYSTEIGNIIRRACMFAFTGILYVPNEGAFIQDDPKIMDGNIFMDLGDLVQKLNANDPNIRHVPFGYKVGEMNPSELATNPFVIALAGEEGAEKLARISAKYNKMPYLWSFRSANMNISLVSALGSWNLDDRLYIVGDYISGFGKGGRAFGILVK